MGTPLRPSPSTSATVLEIPKTPDGVVLGTEKPVVPCRNSGKNLKSGDILI
jgi:hypothetical protein